MTVVHIAVADHELVVDLDGDRRFTLPVGVAALRERELHADPPRPEELTNAIGLVADHLDDVVRADPSVIGADTSLAGPELHAIVAVELGTEPTLPFVLSRDAAEDVFRTVATEATADRRRNPGLAEQHVHSVVPAACAVVAVMRRLQLLEVTIVDGNAR
jgi:exopolyphosphatase/guanosine-5'-triphosphate,3'-diphosphate pyrophosphatase